MLVVAIAIANYCCEAKTT